MEGADRTLDEVALLRPLAPADRARVARECTWRRYAPHEQIIDRMDESQEALLLISGQVRITNFSVSGREVSFDDLSAGSFFGELSAIDGLPRSATVVALQESVIAAMPSSVFKRVLLENPKIAMAVILHLANMIRRATGRIMELSTLGANNRVHAELLRLAKPSPSRPNMAIIRPIPVHSDVAARVSTTRETVARVFSDLAHRGIVIRRAEDLLVPDLSRLEEMVEDVRGE